MYHVFFILLKICVKVQKCLTVKNKCQCKQTKQEPLSRTVYFVLLSSREIAAIFALCTVHAIACPQCFWFVLCSGAHYLTFGELNSSSVLPYFSVNSVQAAVVTGFYLKSIFQRLSVCSLIRDFFSLDCLRSHITKTHSRRLVF